MGEPLKRTTSMKAVVTDPIHLIDAEVSFDQDRSTNDLIIKRHQYIPDDFVDALKSDKMDSARRPSGEFLHMCSIPVSVIEDLLEFHNYDAMNEPIRKTISKLKELGLDAFITSDKQI
jgi:hypothetical protein